MKRRGKNVDRVLKEKKNNYAAFVTTGMTYMVVYWKPLFEYRWKEEITERLKAFLDFHIYFCIFACMSVFLNVRAIQGTTFDPGT